METVPWFNIGGGRLVTVTLPPYHYANDDASEVAWLGLSHLIWVLLYENLEISKNKYAFISI